MIGQHINANDEGRDMAKTAETATIAQQWEHRSIRRFTNEAVDLALLKQIREVADRTATSMGMQMASVVRVTDTEIRQTFAAVTGQDYVAEAPELWVFLVDGHHNAAIYRQKTQKGASLGMGTFFQGFSDAVLMAQNVMNAVESAGLGGVFIGSILNDPARIAEALRLPRLVFPALAILFGKPAEKPTLKPRLPKAARFFENIYPTDEVLLADLESYDAAMRQYVDLRHPERTLPSFTEQVVPYLETRTKSRDALLLALKAVGFRIDVDTPEEAQ